MEGGPAPVAKVGQQVLISPHNKEKILALAVVRQESQAEITRWLIDAALPQLEHAHAGHLNELMNALERMKVDPAEALADMAEVKLRSDGSRRRLTLADLKTADGAWRARYVFGQDNAPNPRQARTNV
jgi:hypothetical protein